MHSRIRQDNSRVTVKRFIVFLFITILLLLVITVQFPSVKTKSQPQPIYKPGILKRVQEKNRDRSTYENALKYSLDNVRLFLSDKNHWFPMETRGVTEMALYGIRNGVIFLQSLNITDVNDYMKKLKSHEYTLVDEINLFLDNKVKLNSLKQKLSAAVVDMAEIYQNMGNIPLNTGFKGYKISEGTHHTMQVPQIESKTLQMPVIGFGTKDLTGPQCKEAVMTALKAGYRRLDTAVVYDNAKNIADAIGQTQVPRSSLFIVSKYPPSKFGDEVQEIIERHLEALGTTYLDLVLLHAPGHDTEPNLSLRYQTWSTLERLHQSGIIKALGVSNFELAQLQQLMEKATIKPQVLQNKFDVYHPGHLQCHDTSKLIIYCREHSILIDAHSPLSGWPFLLPSPEESHVQAIAMDHQRSPAQVVLRWILQKGHSAVTRSVYPQHILENISIFDFELSAGEVQRIDGVSWFVLSGKNCEVSEFENVYGVEWPKKV